MTELAPYLESFDEEPGYLDWARFGPLSPAVRAELLADAEVLGTGRRSGIELVAGHAAQARETIAELAGTDAGHVALQPSTSDGLMQALFGLRGGILLSRREFPSLPVAAARAAEALGALRPYWIDPADGFASVDAVREALTDEIDAVGVSLVDFRTGYLADLAGLREAIGDRLLIVDAVQGFGVVDVDYGAADVVCGNGYKWLRAGRGTGFAVFGDRALDRLTPVYSGIGGADADMDADAQGIVPARSRGALAFAVSEPDDLAMTRLATATAQVRDAGVPAISREVSRRLDELVDCADRHGIPVLTPRDPARRAGILTLDPRPGEAAALGAALANCGVTATAREGRIRLAAHAGTGDETVRLLDDALTVYSAARPW